MGMKGSAFQGHRGCSPDISRLLAHREGMASDDEVREVDSLGTQLDGAAEVDSRGGSQEVGDDADGDDLASCCSIQDSRDKKRSPMPYHQPLASPDAGFGTVITLPESVREGE